MNDLINEQEVLITNIKNNRVEIAGLKKEKAVSKYNAWIDATGTAKEKEDYVKSSVAELDEQILIKEAEINYWYDMLNIIEDKMIYHE